jgi:protein TilB
MAGLDFWCRKLKIVYLQNNLIEVMEGISKCKELEYLNLAVNNISLIQGVKGCESLQKLDFTLNFIDIEDLEESIDNLSECKDIRELYFVGNPLTDWPHWQDYIIARIPTLSRLDGTDITKSMRMAALQKFDMMQKDLVFASRKRIEEKVL